MSSYVHACKGFSEDDLRAIDACFEIWTFGLPHMRRIVRNIKELEYFLLPDRLHKILEAILTAKDAEPAIVSKVYFEACIKHVCKGDPVEGLPMPSLVCRAVEQDVFFNWFCEKYRDFYLDEGQAREKLRKILSGRRLDTREEAYFMSSHAAWVTWNPEGSHDEPIETMTSALLVRACLGLDPEMRNASEPILLLIYSTPTELLKPTIADAGLHYQFEPPPETQPEYGQTRPLRNDLKRRPEAIHKAAPFSLLRSSREVMP